MININLYTYHGVIRCVVKHYRFIDVVAVFMSLCSMVMYRYCYIYLVAYFILRLLCVAFYWPHAWCRCVCVTNGALMLLYPLMAVAPLSVLHALYCLAASSLNGDWNVFCVDVDFSCSYSYLILPSCFGLWD